jgi:hypothetical protein
LNSSYKGFGNNWQLTSGLSYGYSTNKVDLATDKVNNNENAAFKIKTTKSFSDRLKVSFGADYFVTQFKEDFKNSVLFLPMDTILILQLFIPKLIYYSLKWAAKVGVRASNNDLLNETAISPWFLLHIKWLKQSVLLCLR